MRGPGGRGEADVAVLGVPERPGSASKGPGVQTALPDMAQPPTVERSTSTLELLARLQQAQEGLDSYVQQHQEEVVLAEGSEIGSRENQNAEHTAISSPELELLQTAVRSAKNALKVRDEEVGRVGGIEGESKRKSDAGEERGADEEGRAAEGPERPTAHETGVRGRDEGPGGGWQRMAQGLGGFARRAAVTASRQLGAMFEEGPAIPLRCSLMSLALPWDSLAFDLLFKEGLRARKSESREEAREEQNEN
eukprot:TRINITY_DN1614_c0_g1_i3.p1 TRINITY_DN1614_c0_g1~~TRINITY_DN1614_c0_g1_i3.p1  ORF type:complete len:251 (+),score=53.74 TRINITY_DN1614_c0_g1_i3:634-1386(+)